MKTGMQPWRPLKSALTLKHLGKLGEECGELSAAISRCIIQGVDGKEPITGKENIFWVEEEIADVLANTDLVVEHLNLSVVRIKNRRKEKKRKLRVWHGMPSDGDLP
jgi:NTP pyrophosphatase (non-canonical NTP hydrolase)